MVSYTCIKICLESAFPEIFIKMLHKHMALYKKYYVVCVYLSIELQWRCYIVYLFHVKN